MAVLAMIDPGFLRNLVPLNSLSQHNLERLAKRLAIEELRQGAVICGEGDTDNDAIYLIDGSVELASHSTTMKRVMQGGTEEAAFPLAHARPRQFTVSAMTEVRFIRIDNSKLDRAVILDELTTTITNLREVEGNKFAGDSEWLEEMLDSEAFKKLPREKVASLMLKMESLSVKRGDIIIKQGDAGDYYYIVKEGRFNVSRKEPQGKVKILAEMREGSVFGEEALISGEVRNTSVIAMSEGILMRLAKEDFAGLLKGPLLTFVSGEKARKMLKTGAQLLDVRTRDEFKKEALRGSINVPCSELQQTM